MRREGASVKEIAAAVSAAPSSVSGWVAGIVLSDAQRAALDARVNANGGRPDAWKERSRRAREARRQAQDDGRARAREGDPLHQAGCMLY
jgi:hypothetical protein